jgi:transcriptional regulator with XRE-family HTH domain
MFKPQRISELIDIRKKKEKGFTKVQLAAITGLTVKTIDDVTNGKTSTRVENLEALAAAFGVDMNFFFDQFDGTVRAEANYLINSKENPWKLCYDLQCKVTQLEKELADLKKTN